MDTDTARILQKLSLSFNQEIQRVKEGQKIIRDAIEDYSKHIAIQMQGFDNRIGALENDQSSETGCNPTDANLHILPDPDIPRPPV